MIPVELSLSNFLSYGSETQSLDFSRFHVACLSGKNGQGKSALLDAITWVLWGEARKSSGGHKPDDELLRIGSRRMKVEFVFDIEGERYRVIRAYSRSSTGKTSKSELELQLVGNNQSGGGIPLTRSSIRETQDLLNERLGLDYNTFVNSAFLLQGRSDEFTKKRPSDRKNILGRILNLSKYDQLAEIARSRQRSLATEVEKLERAVEIYGDSLKYEIQWKKEHSELSQILKDKELILSRLREEEAGYKDELFALDMSAKEREAAEDALRQLNVQIEDRNAELNGLVQKIEKANVLIQSKGQIQKEHELYCDLQVERDELDVQREVYSGIEKKIDKSNGELLVLRAELEGKIQRVEAEWKAKKQNFEELAREVEARPEIEKNLQVARTARERIEVLNKQLEQRRSLEEHIKAIEAKIEGERKRLIGQIDGIEEQINRRSNQLIDINELRVELGKTESTREELVKAQKAIDQIKDKGQTLGEEISQHEGLMEALRTEQKKIIEHIQNLSDNASTKCPTCGTSLTEEHRNEVIAQFREKEVAIEKKTRETYASIEIKEKNRDVLREKYRNLSGEIENLSACVEKQLQLKERITSTEKSLIEIEALQEEKDKLIEKVREAKKIAPDEYEELNLLREKLDGLEVDENELERCRFQSAQVERYEEKIRNLNFADGRKDSLEKRVGILENQVTGLRNQFESGEPFEPFNNQIRDLKKQLQSCAFKPERFELIRREIQALKHAPGRLKDLSNAEENLDEWIGQRDRVAEIIAGLEERGETLKEKIELLEKRLIKRVQIQEKFDKKKQECSVLEAEIQKNRQKKGELIAKLQHTDRNKEELANAKKELKKKRSDLHLLKKLKLAFGKNGIQSLIIEQALPEIEERASEILYRLSDGKMQVHLETIKDKKSGGTKETLEIIITDEQGVPRPYETYSGGEAFRVNFALRIALSQMLAERNGVKIRTLGIDEGFGTQDEDGVQYLIEAIQNIQDDFDKILVITHLNRLKEAFPVRIEVVKDPLLGSQLTFMEA